MGGAGCTLGSGAAGTGATLCSVAVLVGTLCSAVPFVSALGSRGGNGGGLAVACLRI